MIWYVLMPLIIGFERLREGLVELTHMLCATAVGLTTYKVLKNTRVRERPWIVARLSWLFIPV